ncbi:MAG: hypothetical protein R2932_26935 [Caldilineaceae bacterium]
MTTNHANSQGITAFLADVEVRLAEATAQGRSTQAFVLQIAERYAYIRPQDAPKHPKQFLKQMAGQPPVRFGTAGFRKSIVDDKEPARHYTAFVFVGYWLPTLLAIPVLWAWEILGFFRYGHWSQPDIRSGRIGIRHGRAVRNQGPDILPTLIRRDLTEARESVGQ